MAEKIAIASDHGGFELKNALSEHLKAAGYDVLDLGTHTPASVDYPDIAQKMAEEIKNGTVKKGILLCGTGIGISIAANRFPFIRAALVHDAFGARLCREHNDANVLVLGGRTTGNRNMGNPFYRPLYPYFNPEAEGNWIAVAIVAIIALLYYLGVWN